MKHPNKPPIVEEAIATDYGGEAICACALKTNGSAGPSGINAAGWRRICTSFKSSAQLCSSMALVAKKLCTVYVDPDDQSSFTASRLIALDKHPGMRSIGIYEVSRRIISKVILTAVADEVREMAGCMQFSKDEQLLSTSMSPVHPLPRFLPTCTEEMETFTFKGKF